MECREPRQPWNQCRVPLLPSLPCSIGRTKPFRPHRNLNLSQIVHEAKSQLWNHMESTLIPTKYTKRTTTTMIIVTMVILKINNRFENRFNCISVMERSYVSVVSYNNRQRVQTRSLVFVFIFIAKLYFHGSDYLIVTVRNGQRCIPWQESLCDEALCSENMFKNS